MAEVLPGRAGGVGSICAAIEDAGGGRPEETQDTRPWCWSTDGERFYGELATREEAIRAALADVDREGPTVSLGRVYKLAAPPSIDVQDLLERIGEDAGEEFGEGVEDWPGLTPEQEVALEKELNEVIERHLRAAGEWPPEWYGVESAGDVTDVELARFMAAKAPGEVAGG